MGVYSFSKIKIILCTKDPNKKTKLILLHVKLISNSDLFFPGGIPCQNGAPCQGVVQLHHNPSYVHPICDCNGWMCVSKD